MYAVIPNLSKMVVVVKIWCLFNRKLVLRFVAPVRQWTKQYAAMDPPFLETCAAPALAKPRLFPPSMSAVTETRFKMDAVALGNPLWKGPVARNLALQPQMPWSAVMGKQMSMDVALALLLGPWGLVAQSLEKQLVVPWSAAMRILLKMDAVLPVKPGRLANVAARLHWITPSAVIPQKFLVMIAAPWLAPPPRKSACVVIPTRIKMAAVPLAWLGPAENAVVYLRLTSLNAVKIPTCSATHVAKLWECLLLERLFAATPMPTKTDAAPMARPGLKINAVRTHLLTIPSAVIHPPSSGPNAVLLLAPHPLAPKFVAMPILLKMVAALKAKLGPLVNVA
jgi:hypothetical protein